MLRYNAGKQDLKNWVVSETNFNPDFQGKAEAIMSLGNGYMGLRSATEEAYVGQVRNLFVAGTFNQFDDMEVTELPNAADVTELDIRINGRKFSLEKGMTREYKRDLNLKNGELTRTIIWQDEQGDEFKLVFRRFISMKNLHLIGMKVEITPLDNLADIIITSGIDAQVSNSGAQHFHEGEKRIYDNKYLQLLQHTTESKLDFVINSVHEFITNNERINLKPKLAMDRRKVLVTYQYQVAAKEKLVLEKISTVYTSRDKEYDHEAYQLSQLRENSLADLVNENFKGYNQLLHESASVWECKWDDMGIEIDSEHDFDQLAIRFALYHLMIMAPAHDNRFGIAAKGLSGEGYKGHSFWDTEIFILPFFTYTYPNVARKLLEYRYNTINGARKKAKDNGYEGAMYPWESAFTGDEVTPVWGAVDIVTGKATKIWSGFIEQHITSDISFAVWQYYMITGDEEFMERFGFEILFDTATFWSSRLEWNEDMQRYHINDVIGPDEYKEHINNNAFTNYMAHWNITKAIEYYNLLKSNKPYLLAELPEELDIDNAYKKWSSKVDLIYLPQPREDGVIPQDDTYLTKQIIDLSKYKQQEQVGSIFQDYNLEQVNNIQVSKQADIMILFYLLEDKFTTAIKRANWNYYEPKTLHDSSLSLSTHSILASDMEDSELAYSLFERASRIDLGQNMKSSDHGMHTASIGGVWQATVCGFGGVRMLDGKLRISPSLPKEWEKISFPINWKGDRLQVTVQHDSIHVLNTTGKNESIEIEIHGRFYMLKNELSINAARNSERM